MGRRLDASGIFGQISVRYVRESLYVSPNNKRIVFQSNLTATSFNIVPVANCFLTHYQFDSPKGDLVTIVVTGLACGAIFYRLNADCGHKLYDCAILLVEPKFTITLLFVPLADP